MHNDKDNMPIASDNDQWAKKQIGLKSFKYVKVFANLKQFGVLVERQLLLFISTNIKSPVSIVLLSME